ncbi:MAG: M48 family peptidase, partial [Sulfurovum sp.]|nr:M48 family peptidase [Sulfurovum sp.]
MLETVIGLYSLYFILRFYISVMQIGYINQEKCKAPVLMSAEKYFTAGSYAVAKEKLSLVEMFVDYLIFLWWVMAGFAWLSGVVQVEGILLNAVLFLYGFMAINYIVGLPFELYQTFKI